MIRFIHLLLFSPMLLGILLSPISNADTLKALSISTLAQPIPVPTTQNNLLAYELQFVNTGTQPLRISRIEVWDKKNLLATYVGSLLINNSLVYDQKTGPLREKNIELREHMGAFIFISLELSKQKALPTTLQHKIWVTTVTADKSTAMSWLHTYSLPVSSDKPVVLSAPLHGDQWIAEAAFSSTSYHRRAILPIDGKFYLAQRYAIDWERFCSDGLEVHGNMHINKNWQAYNYEILATADGTISSVINTHIPDNAPPGLPNPPLSLNNVSGNSVIQHTRQHNKDYYILYAHMQPDSIRVKIGQKVTKGQVIGLLGNSGNSAAPHLHLHVTDSNQAEKSNGVPFIFETATLQGKAEEIEEDYGTWVKPTLLKKTKVKKIMPTENQLFFFDNINRPCPVNHQENLNG